MRCAGGSIGGRSALPLCILQVLKDYSDEEHPLTSGAIIQKLEADYGLSAARNAHEHHFMFGGKPVTVVLRMSRSCAGNVLDAFGSRAAMRTLDDDRMEVRVTAALEGMRFFALQFGNHCEVLSPRALREQVMDDIKKMAERYGL